MKKPIALLLAALTLLGVLAGCGAGETASGDGPIEITVGTWDAEKRQRRKHQCNAFFHVVSPFVRGSGHGVSCGETGVVTA